MIELLTIPIDQIHESPTNPRRRFNEAKMQELIQSVKEQGVEVPLLVRPSDTPEDFEIIAGARRHRAAKTAGLEYLPCIIKRIGDDEALELQLLENEQREDVHPLEQAIGYQRLVDRSYTVPAIAAKLGCSESHVYKRLKLLDLIEPAQEAFLDDRITAEHAILIARLQPKDQEKAFKECFYPYNTEEVRHFKQLKDWIELNIHLDLKGAPFKTTDEDLLPEAGSCINCPKRTGFNAHLFPDIQKKDTCTDGACFKKKTQAHINLQIARQEEKGKELLKITTDWSSKKDGPIGRDKYTPIQGKKDSCEHAAKAIVVSGHEGKGTVITVCADPNCKIHKKQAQSYHQGTQEDYQKQQRVREERAAKEQRIRERVLVGIAEKAKDSDWIRDDWNLLALTIIETLAVTEMRIVGPRAGCESPEFHTIKKHLLTRVSSMGMEDLAPFLIELCMALFIPVSPWDRDLKRPPLFLHTAARFKVDVKAIEKEISKEAKAEQKPKSEPKAPKSETKPTPAETKSKKKGTKGKKKETPAEEPCDQKCDSCKQEDCLRI